MPSKARQKKIMEKLNGAQKCSFLTGSSTPKTDINSTYAEQSEAKKNYGKIKTGPKMLIFDR